jgi:hypothetical protein
MNGARREIELEGLHAATRLPAQTRHFAMSVKQSKLCVTECQGADEIKLRWCISQKQR